MAQTLFINGSENVQPGAFVETSVATSTSGLSSSGILAIIGEADAWKAFTQETDLSLNSFGPDQYGDVVALYKSGHIVEAFLNAVVPSKDANITGSFTKCIIVKTNLSSKAQSTLLKNDGITTYGILADSNWGLLGNSLSYTITANPSEVGPTTGAFTFLEPISAFDMSIRLNGGTSLNLTVAGGTSPTAFVTALNGLSGVLATGGTNRNTITVVAGSLSVVASGFNVVITKTTPWDGPIIPQVGDTLVIPTASAIQGATFKNRGSYVVTGSTTTTITARKLLNNSGAPGSVTAPENVGVTPVLAATDLSCFAPIIITQLSTAIIDGIGKTIEINALATNVDSLVYLCYALSPTLVDFVSTALDANIIKSATEQSVKLSVDRQSDNIHTNIVAGGLISLKMGYITTGTCVVTVTPTTLSTVVTGGVGTNLTIALKNYSTINDLAAFINSQPGYTADVDAVSLGNYSPLSLDEGTFAAATTFGRKALRLKMDAYLFFKAISTSGNVVQLNIPPSQAVAGLPGPVLTVTFLTGGAKGSTTEADFQAAIDALQDIDCNFVIPLISRDASLDIIDGDTESGSTYLIDSVNDYTNTHCIQMSTLFNRKNRQCFLSKEDTFANVQVAAQTIGSARASMCFQDDKNISPTAGIVQYQPWMSAVQAAAMQAAGFYKAITHKVANSSGFVQKAGDFNPNNRTQSSNAIKSGLLFAQKSTLGGGNIWVVDQTTYTRDSNFVFNSIQAMYAADVLSLTVAQRMEQAIVGQAVADVNKQLALAVLTQILRDMLKQKILSPSDQAPAGFSNIIININPPTLTFSFTAYLDTEILFIVGEIQLSPVSQSITG